METFELNEKEKVFIEALLDNGGRLQDAAETAGYAKAYVYTLRKRLNKHIIEATKDYFSLHALRAASRVIESMDEKMPNPTNLAAALALLDRVGITKKDIDENAQTVKANIFILPAKND